MAQITQERTGWRDEGISRRHRLWGVENQATDIDGLILNEYKNNFGVITPVALIEYKNQHASAKSYNAPQITAMSELGTRAQLPFFIVTYADNFHKYHISPINDHAKIFAEEWILTEVQYVRFLYYLRGMSAPSELLRMIESSSERKD